MYVVYVCMSVCMYVVYVCLYVCCVCMSVCMLCMYVCLYVTVLRCYEFGNVYGIARQGVVATTP